MTDDELPEHAGRPARGAGRKRSEASRSAILTATRELIDLHGYENLSIGGIAARAGVGKDTIYRWWSSKGLVVADAVLEREHSFHTDPPEASGTVEHDVRAWVHALAADYVSPARAARVRAVTAAANEDPHTAERLYERYTKVQREALAQRLHAGVDTGEVRADADAHAVADAVLGALLYWATVRRTDLDTASVDTLLDVLLRGLRP